MSEKTRKVGFVTKKVNRLQVNFVLVTRLDDGTYSEEDKMEYLNVRSKGHEQSKLEEMYPNQMIWITSSEIETKVYELPTELFIQVCEEYEKTK